MDIKNHFLSVIYELICKVLLIILFAKFTAGIVFDKNEINCLWNCFVIIFIFINVHASRLIKLCVGSEGFEVQLAEIEEKREEILGIQNNIRETYKQMLHSQVALIESNKRLTWTGPSNYDELINIIRKNCGALNLSKPETDYVFEHKTVWEKKERICSGKNYEKR
jgi:hypothetical protein